MTPQLIRCDRCAQHHLADVACPGCELETRRPRSRSRMWLAASVLGLSMSSGAFAQGGEAPTLTPSGSPMEVAGASLYGGPPQPRPQPRVKARFKTQLKVIAGDHDAAQVKRIISRNRQRVLRCYERALRLDPSLAGDITLRFEIDRTGRVLKAAVTQSNVGDPSLASCVARGIHHMRFPILSLTDTPDNEAAKPDEEMVRGVDEEVVTDVDLTPPPEVPLGLDVPAEEVAEETPEVATTDGEGDEGAEAKGHTEVEVTFLFTPQ